MSHLVVKDNALIEASHKLSEVEQRIILLAIVKARESGDSVEMLKDKKILISVDDYVNMFEVVKTTAYKTIKKAVMSLFRAEWGYRYINEKGNKAVRYERFVQSVEYVDREGCVSLVFATAIMPMLVELERRFTAYEIEQVANLSSRYAMRLYEFCLRFLDKKHRKGWLDISVDELRWRFGLLPTEYETMSNFKRKVLDYSIQEINEHTDLIISYKQKKQRQKIVGFTFEFEQKYIPKTAKTNKKPSVNVDNLTDAEREVVASAKAYADEHCKTEQHKNNLIAKALREHREQEVELQAQQQAEQEVKERKKALKRSQTLEKERQVQLHQAAAELRLQAITEQFETLNDDEQRLVLDSVEQSLPKLFVSAFKQAREQGTAHKDKQFIKPFDDIMTLYLQSKH